MKHTTLLQTHSHIAKARNPFVCIRCGKVHDSVCLPENKLRHPDWMFVKRMFTSIENPITSAFQWEQANAMISFYSFKHKDREGTDELIKIANRHEHARPFTVEDETLTTHHRNSAN